MHVVFNFYGIIQKEYGKFSPKLPPKYNIQDVYIMCVICTVTVGKNINL